MGSQCNAIGSNSTLFQMMYQEATAAAWNSLANKTDQQINKGNVTLTSLSFNCTTLSSTPPPPPSTGRRMLMGAKWSRSLLQTSPSPPAPPPPLVSTVAVENLVFLPPTIQLSLATSLVSAFQSAATQAYTTGSFASTFAITGAAVTISQPQVANPSTSGYTFDVQWFSRTVNLTATQIDAKTAITTVVAITIGSAVSSSVVVSAMSSVGGASAAAVATASTTASVLGGAAMSLISSTQFFALTTDISATMGDTYFALGCSLQV